MYKKKNSLARVHINTTITTNLKTKLDDYGIKYSECLRVGAAVLLAENGDDQYTNGLNVYRKISNMQKKLIEYADVIERLRSR